MVEKTNVTKWPIEIIPDEDDLYYRIHKMFFENVPNIIPSAGFRPQGNSMSTDWSKYSTPEESLQRANSPEDNRIVEMNVGDVRTIPLTVNHAPDYMKMNRAHTSVFGLVELPKSRLSKIRTQLATFSRWVI